MTRKENEKPKPSAVSRIDYIDFLKTIGLGGIIAAHSGSPGWVIMLRCFDVPLMVILSAILGIMSYRRKNGSPSARKDYYLSRVKRLIIPTWLFLILYFLYELIADGSIHPFRYYLNSFLLTNYGIDYVWIMLIYLYGALMIPFFSRLKLSIRVYLGLALLYTLYEIAFGLKLGTGSGILRSTFYYIIPYGMLTFLGCRFGSQSHKTHLAIAATGLAVFAAMAIYYRLTTGSFLSVQTAKYPPRLYFLAYGTGCSFTLLSFCERFRLKVYSHPWIRFISAHSLWIYLWHILVLDIYKKLHLPGIWYVKWFVVFLASIGIVLLVNKILDKMNAGKDHFLLSFFRG